MKLMLALCLVLVGSASFGKTASDCAPLEREKTLVAVSAKNLANVNTTRTPEGGPYRPIELKGCVKGECEIEQVVSSPIARYQPDHPDADEQGYVAYPNIDPGHEKASLSLAATKLRLLASKGNCISKAIDNGSSVLIEYRSASKVREDIFNFGVNQQLVSWRRTDDNGATTTANFNSDGNIVSYR